ncbi:MAG: radical SAM/SPASM domain-containing protein [Vulcanimicrobiota bacterium]
MQVIPNANFYSLAGSSDPEEKSDAYIEYRRSWLEYPSKFFLRDYPMHLDVEATSRCNLKCTFCDKLPLLKKHQIGDMDWNLYKRIIDESSKHRLWGLKLSYRGEPLLHKKIVEMVSYAKSKGILDIYFNTNGMLLHERMSTNLINAGLDRISISIEGTDPEAFERERIGAKFKTVLKNVEKLKSLREEKGVNHPKIRIQSVLLPGLDPDFYRTFWMERCDEVSLIDYKDESVREKGLKYCWACPQLWQRMTIEWDGTILPCNNDDIRLFSPGNVNEKPILVCWHDPAVNKMREFHKIGRSHEIEDCDGCPWRTAQIKKLKNANHHLKK